MCIHNAQAVAKAPYMEHTAQENKSSEQDWMRLFIHELKNHLATISMNVEMIEEDMDGKPDFPLKPNRKRITRIKKGIHFMREALQDLRALSNPLEISRTDIDMNMLLHELGDFIEPECYSRGITVEYDLEEGLPPVHTDRKHVSSAVLNLIINAKEAIDTNGVITLRSERRGDMIAISVRDTGGGIAAEDEEKVFNDFFSTKDDGTGLGLSIVKRIAARLEGTVNIDNRRGEGVTFTVAFPLSGNEKG